MKVELRGKLIRAESGLSNKQKPLVYLFVTEFAPVNNYGDKIGYDNFYKVTVTDTQKNPEHSFKEMINTNVIVDCFLNGFEYDKREGGKDIMLTMTYFKITSLDQKKREQAHEQEKIAQYRELEEKEPTDEVNNMFKKGNGK